MSKLEQRRIPTRSILLSTVQRNQQLMAQRMVNDSAKKTPLPNIGDSVSLGVDKVDRGPSDPISVLAVVMDLDEYGNAVLGTKSGKLERH